MEVVWRRANKVHTTALADFFFEYWVCMYHIIFQSIKYVYIYIFSIACEYAYINSIYVAIIFLMVDLYISQYHEYLQIATQLTASVNT